MFLSQIFEKTFGRNRDFEVLKKYITFLFTDRIGLCGLRSQADWEMIETMPVADLEAPDCRKDGTFKPRQGIAMLGKHGS